MLEAVELYILVIMRHCEAKQVSDPALEGGGGGPEYAVKYAWAPTDTNFLFFSVVWACAWLFSGVV